MLKIRPFKCNQEKTQHVPTLLCLTHFLLFFTKQTKSTSTDILHMTIVHSTLFSEQFQALDSCKSIRHSQLYVCLHRASTSLCVCEGGLSLMSELRGVVRRGEPDLVPRAGIRGGGALSDAVGGVLFRNPL